MPTQLPTTYHSDQSRCTELRACCKNCSHPPWSSCQTRNSESIKGPGRNWTSMTISLQVRTCTSVNNSLKAPVLVQLNFRAHRAKPLACMRLIAQSAHAPTMLTIPSPTPFESIFRYNRYQQHNTILRSKKQMCIKKLSDLHTK